MASFVEPVLVGPTNDTSHFLDSYKPSDNRDIMSVGPWYWVMLPRTDEKRKSKPAEDDPTSYSAFEAAGRPLVEELSRACKKIKETAPVRANKKQGIRSQKDLREEKHAEFNAAVKELAIQHDITSGKWLFYGGSDAIDGMWAKIVNGVAKPDGVLAQTGHVHCAKVSTSLEDGRGDSYVICCYCDNSFDKDAVKEVYKALVSIGLVSSAYKADANTILGIDSKHDSGIKSSLYGKNDMMTQAEIEEALKATSKAKPTKAKTLADEEAEGGGFAPVSDSEDDEPPRKKVKS